MVCIIIHCHWREISKVTTEKKQQKCQRQRRRWRWSLNNDNHTIKSFWHRIKQMWGVVYVKHAKKCSGWQPRRKTKSEKIFRKPRETRSWNRHQYFELTMTTTTTCTTTTMTTWTAGSHILPHNGPLLLSFNVSPLTPFAFFSRRINFSQWGCVRLSVRPFLFPL